MMKQLDGTLAGDEGFDPLGLSNIEDLGIDLYWLREAELKHCRVAMLAVVGSIAQELGFVLPGMPTGKNQIEVFWQFFDQNPGPIFASFIFIGIIESKIIISHSLKYICLRPSSLTLRSFLWYCYDRGPKVW